jgi:outer membrane protein assembly factor BamA
VDREAPVIARLVVLVLVACGGGSGAPVTKPQTPVTPPQPVAKPGVVKASELTGAVKKVRVDVAVDSLRAPITAALAAVRDKPLEADRVREALARVVAVPGVLDVTARGVQLADGIELVVEVTAQPVVRNVSAIETGGTPIALGMSAITTGSMLDPRQIQSILESLRERYLTAGHLDVEVAWRRVSVANGVDIVIEVTPGVASTIASVAFTGNKAVASKALAARISKLVVIGQPVLENKLRLAVDDLQAHYWDIGYANVKVTPPAPAPGRSAVVFAIEEGPQFRLGAVTMTGDVTDAERSTYLKLFGPKQGDVFNRSAIVAGRKRVVDAIVASGKPNAEVNPLSNVDLPKRTIDLALEVRKGQ